MPIFRDPMESLSVEIPAGWAYDPLHSSLTDFFFSRWDSPEELLAVGIRRAAAAEGDSDEKWIERMQEKVGGAHRLTDVPCRRGRAVSTTFVSPQGPFQRVVFVRGRRVDLAIEQRCADAKDAGSEMALRRAAQSADSAANRDVRRCGHDDFNRCIESANVAFESEDLPAALDALKEAAQTGIAIWTQSLAAPEGELEINAPVCVAQALAHMGRCTNDMSLLRDAEFILRRGLRTLEFLETEPESKRELAAEMEEALQSVLADAIEPSDRNSEPVSAMTAMRERAFRSTQAAAGAFDAQDWENAKSFAAAAVEDFLSLIASLRRDNAAIIPEEISAHLISQGIEQPEDQRKALQNAREAVLMPAMNASLQIRHCCAMAGGDAETASEAAAVMLPLARLLFNADPGDAGIALNLALALMLSSATAVLAGGEDESEEATRLLNEAERALNSVAGLPCSDDGWFGYHGRQIEVARRELDRTIPSEHPFRSRWTEISHRFQAAAAKNEQLT